MNKFLIILTHEKTYIYQYTNLNEYEQFYINGEELFHWNVYTCDKDFHNLKTEILDVCNLDDLGQIDFDIIYYQVSSEIIKELSEAMLPCAKWQVFNLESLLPELLLKMKKIYPQREINVGILSDCYSILMDKANIKINRVYKKPDFSIQINQIPIMLNKNYEYIYVNHAKVDELNEASNQIIKENSELNAVNSKLQQEIFELKRKFEKKDCEYGNREKVNIQYSKGNEASIYIKNRTIIRAVKSINQDSDMYFKGNTAKCSEGTLALQWMFENKSIVNMNDKIVYLVDIDSYNYESIIDFYIKSSIGGKLFILRDNNEKVKEGDIIAVISHYSDSMEDIKRWVGSLI